MSRVRIIPVLLLHKGGLYKTVQFKHARYIGDPINSVKLFNEKEADELLLLDYRASAEGYSIDFLKIAEIAGEAFMPMAYGGGIQTFSDVQKVFEAGYEKVVLNSTLFTNSKLIKEVANVYGAQSVIGAMDVKKNIFGKFKVYSHSGTKNTGQDPIAWAKNLEQHGVGEILFNSIDREGTWTGYEEDLIKKISEAVQVPLIACGGAASRTDLLKAVAAGASAVAAGSMFVFQKKGMGVLISFPSEGIKI